MSNKFTKKEFLEKLKNECDLFRNNEFKVLGEYRGNNTPIIIKNKYGYLKIRPSELYKIKRITTNSAIFKNEYFKEYLHNESKSYYKREYKIVGDYISNKKHLIVEDKYGLLLSTPGDLLTGRIPTIKSAIDKDKYIKNKLKDYNTFYKNGVFKIISNYEGNSKRAIVEDSRGIKYHTTFASLMNGSNPTTINSCINKEEVIINNIKETRGDFYEYKSIEKNKKGDLMLLITCPLHGDFRQRPYNHKRGEGCPKCGYIQGSEKLRLAPTGWSYTRWKQAAEKSKNFESFKTYIVKIKDKTHDEEYYKVGRTFLPIKKRFNYLNKYCYIEVLKIYEFEDHMDAINKESELLKKNEEYNYKPIRDFSGKLECFSKVIYDN